MKLNDHKREELIQAALRIKEARQSLAYAAPELRPYWYRIIEAACTDLDQLEDAPVHLPFGHSVHSIPSDTEHPTTPLFPTLLRKENRP